MEKYAKDELYSDKYKPADFIWGQSLGEGKCFFKLQTIKSSQIKNMEKYSKDELYSDKYKPADFIWGQSLGEGKCFFKFLTTISYKTNDTDQTFNLQVHSVTSSQPY